MPETVFLAPADEVASIKAKLDKARGNPVVLIAPKSVKALRNPLTLKLLQRHAEFLGKDLVLVSRDRTVRQLAGHHGLAALSSLTQVRRWHPSHKAHSGVKGAAASFRTQGSRLGRPGLALSFLTLIFVALPFLVGYLVIPTANVTLLAATQAVSEVSPITASTEAKAVDHETRTIPGRIVEATFELTDQTDIAGKKPVPDAVATGQVTFMNRVGTQVTVTKGSLLGTKSGVRFRTGDNVALPPTLWSSVRVGIIADQPGKAGNVERLAIEQVIDPQLAARVAVVNENPTQGGTDKEVGAVTIQDRDRLEAQALAKAKNEAFQKVLMTKNPTESVYRETLNVQLVDKQFDRRVGEETKTLSIKLLVKATGLAFEARDVNEAMRRLIQKKIPDGMTVSAEGLRVKPLGAEKWTEKTISFHMQADAKAVTELNEESVKSQIVGKSKAEAEEYLAGSFVLAEAPDVKIQPDWTSALPRFGWRIKINLRVP